MDVKTTQCGWSVDNLLLLFLFNRNALEVLFPWNLLSGFCDILKGDENSIAALVVVHLHERPTMKNVLASFSFLVQLKVTLRVSSH